MTKRDDGFTLPQDVDGHTIERGDFVECVSNDRTNLRVGARGHVLDAGYRADGMLAVMPEGSVAVIHVPCGGVRIVACNGTFPTRANSAKWGA